MFFVVQQIRLLLMMCMYPPLNNQGRICIHYDILQQTDTAVDQAAKLAKMNEE